MNLSSHVVSNLVRDVRYALRALRQTPAFAIGAMATVALAVGTTTAIFSVVYGVLLRQLPYRDVERVFWIWSDQQGRDQSPFNVPDFIDYRDRTRTLAGIAGFFAYGASLSDEAAGERVQGLRATGNFFDVLGARARIGRLLRSSDEQPDGDHVVVLTEPFWTRRFARDPAVVGQSIRLNSEPYVVVGVLEPGFVTPVRDVEFVIPFAPDRDGRRGARNSLNFIIAAGRLAESAAAPRATAELTGIAKDLQAHFPVENARKRGVRLIRVIDGIVGPFRATLLTVFAAVGAVQLIACANLANLMLTRASGRRKEVAVQLALGSSRWQVARRWLVEALAVGVAGGALGILIAVGGVRVLIALAPPGLPRLADVGLDVTVLAFSMAAAIFTGILFGVIPAVTLAAVDVREALLAGSRGTTTGGRRVRGALVAGEVTIAVVLLVVMTMLAKSFAHVQAVTPGFDPGGVLSARLTLPPARFTSREAITTFQRALVDQMSSLPGVTQVSAISVPPLTGLTARVPFTVEGRAIERERVPLAQFRLVSPNYFETVRIALRRGRTFSERDTGSTQPVAVVNEALAGRWLDGRDAIGARLLVDDSDGPPRPVEVIGVVGNVQQLALDATEPTFDLYLPYPQIHPDTLGLAAANMFWLMRTPGEPMALEPAFVRELRRVDADLVAAPIRLLDRYLLDSMAPRRFSVSLIGAFAAAALVLAVTGIYAVIRYSVSQRTPEIGIRIALGAQRWSIVRLIMSDGARFIVTGLLLGGGVAFVLMRTLSAMLFGLDANDPATFGQVGAIVLLASLVACAAPAMRAVKMR